jgi:hypothetical protein
MYAIAASQLTAAFLLATACCARAPDSGTMPEPALSAEQHTAEASRHEAEADEHLAAAERTARAGDPRAPIECLDRPLAGMVYDGPEPIRVMRPCWSSESGTAYHEREARLLSAHAAEHRGTAHRLRDAEKNACTGLGEEELSHSPFYHVEDILRAEALRAEGRIAGARVVFRKVPGLTRDWLTRAVHCHQARAAVMGYSTSFMGYCPLMLQDVSASVVELPDGFAVELRSRDEMTAAAALGRVSDLVALRDQKRRPPLDRRPERAGQR